METKKIVLNGEEIEIVSKYDEEYTNDESDLENTLDLTEDLSKTLDLTNELDNTIDLRDKLKNIGEVGDF